MPIINDSSNDTIFLGDIPVVEVRLGGQLLWPTQVAKPPVEIIELTLPDLNVKPIPNSTLPAFKKKDLDLLESLSSGGLSVGGLGEVALPALAIPALPMLSGIQIPCEGGTLPTRADIVNEFNKLLQMPSQLQVWVDTLPDFEAEVKAKAAKLEAQALAKKEELEAKAINAEGEIQSQIEAEIAEIQEQIEGIIEQVQEVVDLISDILSPYWKKGQIRNPQKEADDAWNELIQEYHIFIPAKMLEMISKVIPIGFNVNVLGINIDVLKILEEEEQNNIIKQIEDEVDRFHAMIPAEYQQFNAEFGVKCDEWRARCTWQYVKSEIVKFCTKTLHEAFGKLIDKFKEIWDTLGLPSLPALLDFDVESFIRGEIESAKQKAEQFKADAITEVEQVESDIANAEDTIKQEAEQLQKEAEQKVKDAEQKIKEFDLQSEAYGMVVDQLEGVSLFGMSLLDVIGGEIDETVKMAEKDIDNLIKAARDFSANWEKELLNVWIKKIKSFLDSIGLGKLLDLLTLTLCDVLPLIGIPTSFDVELPVWIWSP